MLGGRHALEPPHGGPGHHALTLGLLEPEDDGPAVRAHVGAPDLFTDLVVSDPGRRRRRGVAFPMSVALHAMVVALLLLLPILWLSPPPPHPDYIRALLYNPPPPPPPPLPKGSALIPKPGPAKPVTPKPAKADDARLEAPQLEPPRTVENVKPEARADEADQAGSPTGSDFGVPEGMEGGVEGGVIGGVPGGVLGGVIGGTGDGPVLDYDRPPRILKQARPQYPQEAFVKKIEGTVIVELLIDTEGRVVRARVIRSVPELDAAALDSVRQWVFSPAIKHGRPVATVALAPVSFRIY